MRTLWAEGAAAFGSTVGALLGRPGTRVTAPIMSGMFAEAATLDEIAELFATGDPRLRPGAQLVADPARSLDARLGAGGVVTACLAAVMIREADELLRTERIVAEALRTDIARCSAKVRAQVAAAARPSTDPTTIASAAAEHDIADAVVTAVRTVGPEGVVLIEPGDGFTVETVHVHGLRIRAGYESPHSVTDELRREARLRDAAILLFDSVFGGGSQLGPLLKRLAAEDRPTLILVTGSDSDLMSVTRDLRPLPVLVRIPGDSAASRSMRLRDLAVITGGMPVRAGTALPPDTAGQDLLGSAELALVTRDDTVLIGGKGDPAEMARRAATAKARLAGASGAERAALREQSDWLAGEALVLRIGAESAADVRARLARATGALVRVRAALRSGTIVLGGAGSALPHGLLAYGIADPGTRVVRTALAELAVRFPEGTVESVLILDEALAAAAAAVDRFLRMPDL